MTTHGALVVVETFGSVVVPRVHRVNVVAVVHIVPGPGKGEMRMRTGK